MAKNRENPKRTLASFTPTSNVEAGSLTPRKTEEKEPSVSKEVLSLLSSVEEAPIPEGLFSSEKLLTTAEKKFYVARREKYLKEFQLNQSSDLGVIHRVLMEEIMCERLYTKMLEEPDRDFSDRISDSHKRYQMALQQLGASRDQRIKNRESSGQSIADLAKQYFEERKEATRDEKYKRDAEDEIMGAEMSHKMSLQLDSIDLIEDRLTAIEDVSIG